MIYLIGAPPRCGKTTLAKRMSKKTKISWISCDTLESIAKIYISKKDWEKKCPYSFLRKKNGTRNNDDFYGTYSSAKIVKVLKKQSEIAHNAIDMMIDCEVDNSNDYIIEGYHITPSFAAKMIKKYGKQNIKAVFLTKFDENKFAKDVHKSTTPNDWLIILTKKPETFTKVGKMVKLYSKHFEREAIKFKLPVFNLDDDFNNQINNVIKYLIT